MRLGLSFGYQDWGKELANAVELAQEADRLGYHSGWTAEAYGTDAITPITWLLAHTTNLKFGSSIMQMPARTPAMTAMTAVTLDLMSGGRFLCGLGLSGPQVVEGWHGQPYGKPLGKTREYVEILRAIWKREAPLEHHGAHYDIPYRKEDASGFGKPLKLMVHPSENDIPIYIAAIGPKNVELVAEIADGWLPIFSSPTHLKDSFGAALDAGFARASQPKTAADFDIAPTVTVITGDDKDLETMRGYIKPTLALYIGGMGPRENNFYNNLACRYGYEAEAKVIQDLYLDGKKKEAAAAVPDKLVDEVSLLGSRARIADQLDAWKESGITTLIITANQREVISMMAELVL